MLFWQQILIIIFGILTLIFFIKSAREIKNKKNVYGLTPHLFFLGSFVWGDMIVLGPFWIIVSLISILLNNWYLFWLFVTVFWIIRSLGEVIYWLNEQFSGKNRNPPHTLKLYNMFQGDSIWFIYQLFWQCIFIFSIILSMYFGIRWLESI